MSVVLISTYELGRQPFGLASPAAWLRAAGVVVRSLDLTRTALDEAAVRDAGLIAFHLPMHTATRLAVPVIERVRRSNPAATLVAFGLYAPANGPFLRSKGVDVILGPECEGDLVRYATSPSAGTEAPDAVSPDAAARRPVLPRLQFLRPDRSDLPPLSRYASLQLPNGERLVAGYTEATRGCKHLCRHCPVVPVYGGQFRIVQPDVVLQDVLAQVAAGARHISFGDPDFLNGPAHARRIVQRMSRECPGVTYDVVVKVEHILKHVDLMGTLRDTGCLFVTSAVESFEDPILARLEKGHTRADIVRAVEVMRAIDLPLVPTFVPFTPWTTRRGYLEMLDAIETLDLVEHVAPIQLAIRLLVPEGSRLLDLADMRDVITRFDAGSLAYTWAHPDPHVDELQRAVLTLVGSRLSTSRRHIFDAVRRLARHACGEDDAALTTRPPGVARAAVPYMNEPWYC